MFFNLNHHEHLDIDITSFIINQFKEVIGGQEIFVQHLPSILAACENPNSILPFTYRSIKSTYAMPQTNQMWLEFYLLENRVKDSCYTVTYSFRDEIDIDQRLDTRTVNKSFVMFEFEQKGNFSTLLDTIKRLVTSIGFKTIYEVSYEDVCLEFNVSIIDDKVESLLNKHYGADVVLLKYFPERTNPFWNMDYDDNKKAYKKVDVIINGEECGGGAERSCDRILQEVKFYSIEDGKYCQKLYEEFGMEKTIAELDKYLNLPFIPRVGMGWGISRLVKAVKNR
ncbi:MAG TPA: hypothetical protein PKD00_01430 [Burkholderiales bacterium]|nr:hypothetical protein [Burkholderiales bacterium]